MNKENAKHLGSRTDSKALHKKRVKSISTEYASEHYSSVYSMTSLMRIELIEKGIPAIHLNFLAEHLRMSRKELFFYLRLPKSTALRKIKYEQNLGLDESERVLGMEYLIGQASKMAGRSNTGENFDVAKWVSNWLRSPLPALGNKKPAEYMKTIEGQKYISNMLATTQSGAYI